MCTGYLAAKPAADAAHGLKVRQTSEDRVTESLGLLGAPQASLLAKT